MCFYLRFLDSTNKAPQEEDEDDEEDDGLSLDDLNFFAEDETEELFDDEELKLANTPYDQREKTQNEFGIKLPVEDSKPQNLIVQSESENEIETDDIN